MGNTHTFSAVRSLSVWRLETVVLELAYDLVVTVDGLTAKRFAVLLLVSMALHNRLPRLQRIAGDWIWIEGLDCA